MTFDEWAKTQNNMNPKSVLAERIFQAGAASRNAEVVSLTNQRDYEYVRAENAEQERNQLRTELVKALAACKAKDEAILRENYSLALSFQPDDSALKAWLGEPVGTTTYGDIDAMRRGLLTNFTVRNTEEMKKAYHSDFLVDLYIKPKELK